MSECTFSPAKPMPAKYFTSQGPNLYGKYLTGQIKWAEATDVSDLESVYGGGYLPFSGDLNETRHLFYMARSLRVDLGRFSLKKKRRYDHRTWLRHGLERRMLEKEAFLEQFGPVMMERATEWMHPRFGESALSSARLEFILASPFLNYVIVWELCGRLTAFALVVRGDWGAHYWYIFYQNGGGLQTAPGHGYLIDFLDWCKADGLPFAYLGTAYAGKSRYKSRGINGSEFWNGIDWSDDLERLAELQGFDDEMEASRKLSGP